MINIEKEKEILKKIHPDMLANHTTNIDEEMGHIAEDAFMIPPNGLAVVEAKNPR